MTRATRDRADLTAYGEARWRDLVAGLEAEGVRGATARMAVAEALVAAERGWSRRVATHDVDREIWATVRERAGLPPGGHAVPVASAPVPGEELDRPGPWLARAGARRRLRRRVRLRRTLWAGVALMIVVGAATWWSPRPEPPLVRAAANPLPVAWYADGELHLDRVVVRLPGVQAFDQVGEGAAVRLEDGSEHLVTADGELTELRREASLDAREPATRSLSAADFEILDQVRAPDGATVRVVLYRKGWDSLKVDRYVAIVCRLEVCREHTLEARGRVRFS